MSEAPQISVVDAFKARHSIRNYNGKFEESHMATVRAIVEEANKLTAPFGTNGEIAITEPGISKYGLVTGEGGWIVLKIPETVDLKSPEFQNYMLDTAFKGCYAVMKMTQNGIATNWVAGTYDTKLVASRFPGSKVICTIAFGIDSEKKRFTDYVAKWFTKGDRLAYNVLFYDEVAKKMIEKQPEGKLGEILECVRWLPSAYNKQPWRLSFNEPENKFKIFDSQNLEQYTPLDIGIMIGGFYFYSEGKCQIDVSKSEETFPKGGKYVCSIKL
ncbi:hypothetical protein TVAG_102150 [Trichomonas vaginalis G3]|uniref:Putative nitroreductase TM1586 domain-containing protein n=1 Tax=Trichomonas vaginalis (strain ATCC PRA-98 / G3) TaxID=412133 RepID=A2FEH3_TRIV3|nr:putative TM nitroreductase family [Trichomonas vaginalis G3]EAX96710.1 hypothetical protein TVAG_102150 [Trichomonas vaginalis G3]KAI5509238.1 putative TM nitroreductase family [Trichomonas vaginalis G3]|eukprot:XP_001309640.1 hypothetical protein [Trichomonas vaginalis G3]